MYASVLKKIAFLAGSLRINPRCKHVPIRGRANTQPGQPRKQVRPRFSASQVFLDERQNRVRRFFRMKLKGSTEAQRRTKSWDGNQPRLEQIV